MKEGEGNYYIYSFMDLVLKAQTHTKRKNLLKKTLQNMQQPHKIHPNQTPVSRDAAIF
jgi:hypothetical protein